MNKLKIGEMAKLNNISVQALRHYDKIGLLKPFYIDEYSGYRFYHINQSAKLDLINYMKLLGMSLEQIKNLFEKNNVDLIMKNIDKQLEWIKESKRKLDIMERGANRFKFNLSEYAKASEKCNIHIVEFPQRKIFCYDGGINIYEESIETYEYILRELKNQVLFKNLPMIYFCNVGSIIRESSIKKKEFKSTEIFVFVEDDFTDSIEIEIVKSGKYACLYFKGEDGFKNEFYYTEKLLNFIEKEGYEIIGDYLCEVITELPVFSEKSRGMFIRLQIQIK